MELSQADNVLRTDIPEDDTREWYEIIVALPGDSHLMEVVNKYMAGNTPMILRADDENYEVYARMLVRIP